MPERWLGEGVDSSNLLSFSSGARNCLGQHLAMIEAKSIMIQMLRNYEI